GSAVDPAARTEQPDGDRRRRVRRHRRRRHLGGSGRGDRGRHRRRTRPDLRPQPAPSRRDLVAVGPAAPRRGPRADRDRPARERGLRDDRRVDPRASRSPRRAWRRGDPPGRRRRGRRRGRRRAADRPAHGRAAGGPPDRPDRDDGRPWGGGVVMSGWPALLLTGVLLSRNALFVAAEFALISARRTQLEPEASAGRRSARLALKAMENVTLAMAAAQLGITMCSLGLGAISEPAIAHLLEPVFGYFGVPDALVHP